MNNWRNDFGVRFRCGYILRVWDHLLLCPPLSFPDEKRVFEIYDKVKARYIRKLSGETIRSFVDRRFYVPRSIMRLVGR